MKLYIPLVVACTILLGCDPPRPRQKAYKVVAEKVAATQQQLSIDIFDDQAVRTRASTVYYLISEDGCTLSVTLKEYAEYKVGDSVGATNWDCQ